VRIRFQTPGGGSQAICYSGVGDISFAGNKTLSFCPGANAGNYTYRDSLGEHTYTFDQGDATLHFLPGRVDSIFLSIIISLSGNATCNN
jgi:hypothetical protein